MHCYIPNPYVMLTLNVTLYKVYDQKNLVNSSNNHNKNVKHDLLISHSCLQLDHSFHFKVLDKVLELCLHTVCSSALCRYANVLAALSAPKCWLKHPECSPVDLSEGCVSTTPGCSLNQQKWKMTFTPTGNTTIFFLNVFRNKYALIEWRDLTWSLTGPSNVC